MAWAQAPASGPVPIGKPHVCMQNYPPEAIRTGQQGRTSLSFRITAEGTVADIVVSESSGFEALDKASVACAAEWRYQPAVRDGKPIEVPWQAKVRWSLSFGHKPPFDFAIESDTCRHLPPLTAAQWANVRRPTMLAVTLTQGKFSSLTVTQSSGSAELDALADKCFDGVEFDSPDGKPLSGERRIAIEWKKPAPQ